MTHEYVIAVGGRVEPCQPDPQGGAPTAIAWAADHVLAVGADTLVRAISRGDSTFIDVGGCVITPLPADLARSRELLQHAVQGAGGASAGDLDVGALLVQAGLLTADAELEPGSPADLAFWDTRPPDSGTGRGAGEATVRLVAVVRAGAFTEGDEHRGPFSPAGRAGTSRAR